MAWKNPVTTWGQAGKTVPVAGDFNRIEGNTQYLKDEVDSHKAENASTAAKGHVQLSSSTSSTSTSLAATARAVKTVKDDAKAYTDAHEQKAAPHSGHETPAGAQAKANAAETNAKSHANGLVGILSSLATTAKNNIVAAINEIHSWLGQLDNDFDAHQAEKATETKLGHVKAKTKEDGSLASLINILNDNNVYNAVLITDITKTMGKSDNYGGFIYAIAVDDNNVYVGGGTTRTVKKLNKYDLSQVAESVNYGGAIYTIAVDNNYVYVGGTDTQTVRKLNKSNLSLVAESADYGGHMYAMAIDDNNVYVGGWGTQTVQKLNKSNLSKAAESAYYGEIEAIAVDDNHVYVGGSYPRTVRKLNKSNLSQVAESANYGGDINAIAVIADDNNVYVGGEGTQTVWRLGGIHIKELIRVV